jgi:outer membrane protein OmpA-like peptidoglycan-associated protein
MAGLAIGVFAFAPGVQAQSAQIDLNNFRPSELTTDGFAVSTADGQGHLRFGFQFYVDYSDDPLTFYEQQGNARNNLNFVDSQLSGHFLWSLGLWDHLVIFMDLPYHFKLKSGLGAGEEAGFGSMLPDGGGLGDLYLGARGNLFGTRENVFQIALQGTLTFDTASAASSNQNYLGQKDGGAVLGGWVELLMTFNAGDRVRIPINVGYKFNQDVWVGQQNPTTELYVGNEFTYGLGLMIELIDDRLSLIGEVWGKNALNDGGQSGLNPKFTDRITSPMEALGGLKWTAKFGLALGVAGSAGIIRGYGAPDWRTIGTLGFTMPEKDKDSDGDGILNDDDQCPDDPEDIDGFQDEDGCPDPDNDADGVLDVNDGAPMDPEDIDGFQDEDGVPDPDNDGDGILDVNDRCPNEPGTAENEGCPDPDRDGDGVPDRIDNCPDEIGTVENFGCKEKQLVEIRTDRLEILDMVYFRTNSHKLQNRSFPMLDNIAQVLIAHPEIPKVRIEGHTDHTGKLEYNMKLSQRRADSVRTYLIKQGVSADRLEAEGFGPTQPIVPDAKTAEELAQNRRVEFVIPAVTEVIEVEDGDKVKEIEEETTE